jgi:hypothetical protein
VSALTSIFGTGRVRAAKRLGAVFVVGLAVGLPLTIVAATRAPSPNVPMLVVGIVFLLAACLPMFMLSDLLNGFFLGLMRAAPRARAAAAKGMTYSRTDPAGLDDVRWKGIGPGVAEHVATGTMNGLPVHWFEWSTGVLGRGGTFACAAVDLGTSCPPLLLGRRGSGLDEAELPRVELEAVEFNRAFVVACADDRFATTFCDAKLMAWLVDAFPKDVYVEANGRYVMCWTPMRSQRSGFGMLFTMLSMFRGVWDRELDEVLATAGALAAKMPRILSSLYPAEPAKTG